MCLQNLTTWEKNFLKPISLVLNNLCFVCILKVFYLFLFSYHDKFIISTKLNLKIVVSKQNA